LVEALEGCRFSAQHALLIGGILRHIDFLDTEITALGPSLSTSGETLTIEESMTLRARTENAGDVGDEHEWSWSWSRG